MAHLLMDVSRLHHELVDTLRGVLVGGEQPMVVVNGFGKTGLVATNARVLLAWKGGWQSWPYSSLSAFDAGYGFMNWVALRGPELPTWQPGFGEVGQVDWAIQVRDAKLLKEAVPVLERLLDQHRGLGLPAGVVRTSSGSSQASALPAAPTHRYTAMPGAGEELLAEAEGSGGHIWVWADRLRIKHFGVRGILTKGVLKGDKDIWLDQISGIQWREPGSLTVGHIQFTLIGGSTDSHRAGQDENAVMFEKHRRAEFERVKLVVEQRIRETRLRAQSPSVTPAAASPATDPYEALQKLGQLRDAGVLTPEEFERKKAEIMARL